ncbi:MAG: hypothetical protein A2V85_02720 [Chloroflexi bacterium RBG_16_72_14]|nr:MAG: hypothetical protein A2V85_02720 [Chloroflexi bacterium RBG_16_72_14]
MLAIRVASVQQRVELDAARSGVLATRLAELMGVFERPEGARVDRAMIGALIEAAADAGLAEQVAARPDARDPGEDTIRALLAALIDSPRPAAEIAHLAPIFGYPVLGRLVGASVPSLRRYGGEGRRTPDAVAQRVHLLAQLVAILRGSFNEFGIRRWFERPHPDLTGQAPGDLLARGLDPADPEAAAVVDAALRLLW